MSRFDYADPGCDPAYCDGLSHADDIDIDDVPEIDIESFRQLLDHVDMFPLDDVRRKLDENWIDVCATCYGFGEVRLADDATSPDPCASCNGKGWVVR